MVERSSIEPLRIFVSGKQGELDNERAIIIELINELGFQPVASENRPALPMSMEEAYKRDVRTSDIYIGVFGACESDPSIDEFYQARGKPKLVFKKEQRGRTKPKMKEFLDNITDPKKGVVVYRKFKLVTELKKQVREALIIAITLGFRKQTKRRIIPHGWE